MSDSNAAGEPAETASVPGRARIRVLVADDHELAREALTSIIGREPDLEVVGEARDGLEAVREATRLRPHLVVMDVRMPVMDGVHATRLLRQALPETREVVLTSHEGREIVMEALRAGAAGYLPKGASRDEVLTTLREVLAGAVRVQPDLAARLLLQEAASGPTGATGTGTATSASSRERRAEPIAPLAPPASPAPEALLLTEREREVLLLVARGLTNEEIGRELHLTLNTVKTHVAHALRKLGAADRAEAAGRAAALGLLRQD